MFPSPGVVISQRNPGFPKNIKLLALWMFFFPKNVFMFLIISFSRPRSRSSIYIYICIYQRRMCISKLTSKTYKITVLKRSSLAHFNAIQVAANEEVSTPRPLLKKLVCLRYGVGFFAKFSKVVPVMNCEFLELYTSLRKKKSRTKKKLKRGL